MAVTGKPRKLRLAALRCFTIPDVIAKERGQFDRIFADWIDLAVEERNNKHGPYDQVAVEHQGYDVVDKDEYPQHLDHIDGLIITGSTASAYDDEPWVHKLSKFIQDIYLNHSNVKIYGGCFGHQIVSQALLGSRGVRVVPNPKGWEIGVHRVELNKSFRDRFPGLLRSGNLSYQFLHQDNVSVDQATLPANWIQVGATPLCEVQGLFDPGRVLTLQGHPEFDSYINRLSTEPLARAKGFSKEQRHHYSQLIEREDSRQLAGQLVLEFFCHTS
ncbi:unnamed protein product [Clonostachys rosea]|uniref:Glutamine amidotransferase domain-containing protein n=1 Tax=Bionectria ochroleuca TaxID=29856 RepID=A0ABY6V6R3_BIOOC|nr:unnamed protein product [Clonostachys rosea]